MSAVSQQASAVEAAIRILVGGAKPSKGERDYIAIQLKAAAATLRNLEYQARA